MRIPLPFFRIEITRSLGYVIPMSVMADMLSANNRIVEILYNAGTAINMEQQTFMIKNFSRITK